MKRSFCLVFYIVFLSVYLSLTSGCRNEVDVVPSIQNPSVAAGDSTSASNAGAAALQPISEVADAASVGAPDSGTESEPWVRRDGTARFATYNVAMNRKTAGALRESLGEGGLLAGKRVAEIVQRVRPDVLLLNEVDFDADNAAINTLLKNYFAVSQNGQTPIKYPYIYTTTVNTGVPSGMDLDLDGKSDGPGDGFGYGAFPGQYGMVVLSQFPIVEDQVRTMQKFLWKDMPEADLPSDPESKQPFYTPEVLENFRLSSKSHWDVPINMDGTTVHFLVCHPTPPVFDGPEDRNGKRNHDEVRLWADYVSPKRSGYIYDDVGKKGGLDAGAHFVIAGDLNSDPIDGDSRRETMKQLLEHPLLHADQPPEGSGGGVAKSQKDGRANRDQKGDPNQDTGDFPDNASGNLRIDYVLPSKTLKPVGSGVFWPPLDSAVGDLVRASDHRLVWIDVELP